MAFIFVFLFRSRFLVGLTSSGLRAWSHGIVTRTHTRHKSRALCMRVHWVYDFGELNDEKKKHLLTLFIRYNTISLYYCYHSIQLSVHCWRRRRRRRVNCVAAGRPPSRSTAEATPRPEGANGKKTREKIHARGKGGEGHVGDTV